MNSCKHIKEWLTKEEAEIFYKAAFEMGLEQRPVIVYDKEHMQPRLTAWCCDTGQPYGYSGQSTPACPWPEPLKALRIRLEEKLGQSFPSMLANLYRDGQDCVGWHRDDEKLFGNKLIIATISLGGTRKFQLRNKLTKDREEYIVSNGDLLIMDSNVNRNWEHCVPRTAKVVEPRISLTYRTMGSI